MNWSAAFKSWMAKGGVAFGLAAALPLTSAAANTNGFAVKFASADGKVADTTVLPNLWLYVEDGKPATPFVPAGKFTATFEGVILGELRANYFFKAEELGGSLKLEINNTLVLDTSAPGTVSKSVQINKGANAVKATFVGPAKGDGFLRIGWTEKGTNVNPIPNSVITHPSTPDLEKAQQLYLGRELFLENRCARCHTEKFASAVPELAMDAPSFDGMGARRNYEWMTTWILDPKSTRTSVHMPKLLQGAKAKEDAEAIAVYLSSLSKAGATDKAVQNSAAPIENAKATAEIAKRSGAKATVSTGEGNEQPAEHSQDRKPIFERLHCISCHNAPDKSEDIATKISLKHVAAKFGEGKLAEFLKAPEKHFERIRMPNFKLADSEANELSEFLLKHSDKSESKAAPTDKAI